MINVESSDEFKRLLEALASDVGNANIHWHLYRDLMAAHEASPLVGPQSRTFWYLTLNAHMFAAVQSLSRAYDQNSSALHLLSWLNTIRENLHLFETAEFKKRLAGNPFVESLAEDLRTPEREQLDQDIALCSVSDSKVRALILHRNNIGAHRNARTTAIGRSANQEFAISVSDFESLLDRAHEIVNRYSYLFSASTYSRQIVGHDDYRYIFQCVQESLDHAQKRYDEVLAKYESTVATLANQEQTKG